MWLRDLIMNFMKSEFSPNSGKCQTYRTFSSFNGADITIYKPKVVDKIKIFKFIEHRKPYTGQDLNLKIFMADLLRGEKLNFNNI